jgi:hypothetical protein
LKKQLVERIAQRAGEFVMTPLSQLISSGWLLNPNISTNATTASAMPETIAGTMMLRFELGWLQSRLKMAYPSRVFHIGVVRTQWMNYELAGKCSPASHSQVRATPAEAG